ncbi:MAG TPA: type VI secretion system-associated FHA domain protein TagH [Steroidobacteraceae bacterium]|nr:type VI secretion system-associated FHA domain protein TagH [Steroidobacteraceae bacterium]
MPLMLEVVGVHAASMGADVRRLLGDSELKIGRDSDNDWILPQSYVSRHQAVIRCVNGMYFLEQVGSCPIVLNETGRPLERNRIARLSAGDRIMIDDIEIHLTESDAMPSSAPSAEFSTVYPAMAAAPAADLPLARGGPIDPLELLGVRPPDPRPHAPRAPEFGSILDDAMVPGAVASPAQSSPALPDNWFGTTFSPRPAPVAPQAPQAPQPPHAPAPLVPHAPQAPLGRRTAPPMGAPATGTLENLLRGAGLDPAQTQLSQEVAGQLGEVLRIVVEGTMQVLQARNQIRKEFRMATTQVTQKNNNPLKFSADVADALHKLLVQRSPAYLDTVNSFTDAFDDIRVHQFAMLASLRVAFDYMLQQFDPDVLQAQFARQAGRGSVLGIGGKPKPWEAYVARYGELAADRDFAFRRLFGEEFGKAYEQNLEQQKRLLEAKKNVK